MKISNSSVNERIRLMYKSLGLTLRSFSIILNISEGTFKSMFTRDTNPSFDMMQKIADAYPLFSMDWLLTGEGDMYKPGHNSGDNIVNQSNTTNGDNNNVVLGNNSGSMGNVNNTVMLNGENSGVKKIMDGGKMTIDMQQSAELELLQQKNMSLETRIMDLENTITSKDKTIEAMQLLIDTLK